MKNKLFIPITLVFALLGLLFSYVYAAAPSGLSRSVFGSVGGEMSNGQYQALQTACQPLAGQMSNGEYQTNIGFWHTVPDLLALYVLAFDHKPTSTHNLAPYYPDTLAEIVAATRDEPNKTAVILADLDGVVGEAQIVIAQDGVATTVPIADVLTAAPGGGYDMTDGNTVGAFIQWARAEYAATQTTLSYVGHGTFLAPDTDVSLLFDGGTSTHRQPNELIFPVPIHQEMGTDLTDHEPLGLISPYDLALALKLGTNDGANPLAVVDLTHCFAASIEEFYELSNPDGSPYAQMLTGSPNYAYFGPQMPGKALAAMEANQSASQMANALIGAYDSVLEMADLSDGNPDVEHPRLLVAVESSKLVPIKQSMDQMADALLASFAADETGTKNKIVNAYRTSGKYDTTFCSPADFELAPGDALSDLAQFSQQLASEFGVASAVGTHATNVATQTNNAISARYAASGIPWYATPATPTWSLNGSGLALYTDLQGTQIAGNTTLSWHARWYSDSVSAENPHPYAFVQGSTTWADVFQRFWEGQSTLATIACLPEVPPVTREGELSVNRALIPERVAIGVPVIFGVELTTGQASYNPLVRFRVMQAGREVFSDTVGTGYLLTGTHQIQAKNVWTPTISGPFTLDVWVDADNRLEEANEADNHLTQAGVVEVDVCEITLDNADSEGVEITGVWQSSSVRDGYFGDDYLHDQDTDKGSKRVRFTPQITSAGRYQVELRWTAEANRASNTPVEIQHAGGTDSQTVNQRQNGGQWVALGTYNFDYGRSNYVELNNTGTDGHVIADAVRFTALDCTPFAMPRISFSPPISTITLSDVITVRIQIDDIVNLYASQLKIEVDPTIVEVIDAYGFEPGTQIKHGQFLPPDTIIRNNADNTHGTIDYLISLQGEKPGVDGSGTLAEIAFRPLMTGTTSLIFSNVLLSDPQSKGIRVVPTVGQIVVEQPVPPIEPTPTLTVTGSVTLERRNSNAGTLVCIEGTCVNTAEDGEYTLPNMPITGTVTFSRQSYLSSTLDYVGEANELLTLDEVRLLGGDVDQNGQIDILDANLIGRALDSTPDDAHWDVRADITDDDIVNVLDMTAVQFNWHKNNVTHRASVRQAQRTSTQTKVLLSPTETRLGHKGDSTEMELQVEQVNNLYSFSIEGKFDPTLLQVRDANPNQSGIQLRLGDFLDSANQFVLINQVDNDNGVIQLSVTQTHPAEAKSGSGILGTITFESIGEGNSAIQLTQVQLVDDSSPNPQLIATNTQNGQVVIGPQRVYLPLVLR